MRRIMVLLLLMAAPALAQGPPPDLATLEQRMAKRYPQPVRVGDLIGRQVLDASERQRPLGRVEGVTRLPDGHLQLRLRIGGLFGLGARQVAVPVEAMALLGQDVVAVDYAPAQIEALPTASGPGAALAPDTTIRMGLTRPFH